MPCPLNPYQATTYSARSFRGQSDRFERLTADINLRKYGWHAQHLHGIANHIGCPALATVLLLMIPADE
ncbi:MULTISPECIES: hypothetical protein [Stenotrophomonas]|uniref:hypothetical protein n=1 Tax=Stenotrophomonas TaxID=40323 RepID=UPI000A701837|nr:MULTISPECIES: hypothetical protein [Stenotrophomonas]